MSGYPYFPFRLLGAAHDLPCEAKAMSEAQFLAGEDARGVLVLFEPETQAGAAQMDALVARGALGFVTDYTPDRFERPDDIPAPVVAPSGRALLALAVSPRSGVRLRTLAATGKLRLGIPEGGAGSLTALMPVPAPRRDRSHDPEIRREDILDALTRVGVARGDTLLVHCSLSACGHIAGGSATIIEALREAIGPEGNFFVPTFLHAACFLNGIGKVWDFRPSCPSDRASEAIRWVGTFPLDLMRLYPDAPRGIHISHPWAGLGPRAAEVLSRQAEDEPPFSDHSCPMLVRDMGGKILHFGSPVGHTSFVHCFENHYHLPGPGPTYYCVRRADGTITWKYVPDGLPGPREFYDKNENARFFREAVARGLEIRRAQLGLGELKLIDCRRFWEIGSALVQEDPHIIIG